MVSSVKSMIKSENWTTIYPSKSVDIFKGQKQGNAIDLLGAIAINGNSKTTDIAKFIYGNKFHKLSEDDSTFPWNASDMALNEIRKTHLEKLRFNFNRLLTGRQKSSHGGKKIRDKDGNFKTSPNPIDFGYVIDTGKIENDKGNFISHYFLTLKGFLLVSGYDLKPNELKFMIYNASEISVFFCFIKTILDNTSVDFVTEIFIKPIQKVLLRSDIFQGGDLDFYFSNFADSISLALLGKMKTVSKIRKQNILKKPDSYFSKKITSEYMKLHPTRIFTDLIRIKKRDELQDIDNLLIHFKKEGIESLMDNVFHSTKTREDWYDSLFDHFYPSKEPPSFFLKFGYNSERHLMNKVMQSISLTYAYFDYGVLPYKEKKLPRSKAWKRNQKYKKPDKAFFKKYGSKFKPRDEHGISNLY
jgi:hypothetical protein